MTREDKINQLKRLASGNITGDQLIQLEADQKRLWCEKHGAEYRFLKCPGGPVLEIFTEHQYQQWRKVTLLPLAWLYIVPEMETA